MMYLPKAFKEERTEKILAAVRETQFATLVSNSSSGFEVSHLPMLAHLRDGRLVLEGHLSNANPHLDALRESGSALAIFLGPNAYVSPGWYPTKRETGKVVPTWNYSTVHVRGTIETFSDSPSLLKHLNELTDTNEASRTEPWAVADAPHDFLQQMLRSITGIRLLSTRVEAKWKMSQNRSEADRRGVIDGLLHEGPTVARTAETMIELELERSSNAKQVR